MLNAKGRIEMGLEEEVKQFSKSIDEKIDKVKTEEATKTAFILPFIRLVLGYDHTDPGEVVPEFIADVGKKKGEKVDYAIIINNKPIILMECKPVYADLDKEHAAQLRRYFTETEAKFGILTNGIIYKFYTDIEKVNLMDEKPFFELDLRDVKDNQILSLKQFTKSNFNMENILESASELKYKGEIKKIIAEQLKDPSDDFIRFFAKQVYKGVLTKNAKEQFNPIIKAAIKEFINEQVDKRLEIARHSTEKSGESEEEIKVKPPKGEIVTTEEEWEGYYIVKSILSEIINPERVFIRDRKYYCGVLLDDNQLKVICRMHFDGKQKYLGLFDKQENSKGAKKEERVPIENVNDIYKHATRIKNTINLYG